MIAFHDPELSNHLNEIGFIPDVSYHECKCPDRMTTTVSSGGHERITFVFYCKFTINGKSKIVRNYSCFWLHTRGKGNAHPYITMYVFLLSLTFFVPHPPSQNLWPGSSSPSSPLVMIYTASNICQTHLMMVLCQAYLISLTPCHLFLPFSFLLTALLRQ